MTHPSERMSDEEIIVISSRLFGLATFDHATHAQRDLAKLSHKVITQLRVSLDSANEQIGTLRTQLAEAEVLLHGARQIIEAHADPEAPAFAGPRHELVGAWHNEISVFIDNLPRLTPDVDASGEGVGK